MPPPRLPSHAPSQNASAHSKRQLPTCVHCTSLHITAPRKGLTRGFISIRPKAGHTKRLHLRRQQQQQQQQPRPLSCLDAIPLHLAGPNASMERMYLLSHYHNTSKGLNFRRTYPANSRAHDKRRPKDNNTHDTQRAKLKAAISDQSQDTRQTIRQSQQYA